MATLRIYVPLIIDDDLTVRPFEDLPSVTHVCCPCKA